ncbi:hypothetical protein DID88_001105 [Monilinia fructigena]|uniref:Uncharacterized protein n=1 Tax=Monilinia fructigena TaxID=38457 RepID=A0A395IZ53_9HELO|nr:hypothetical protein DID88_001105 [Monilinia fructigena]
MVIKGSNSTADVLILGAGWTSTFLIPLSSTEGNKIRLYDHYGSRWNLQFRFDSEGGDENRKQIHGLPTAKSVLVTFPLKGKGQSRLLVEQYSDTHSIDSLGDSGIYIILPIYSTRKYRNIQHSRPKHMGGCVLNLSGLWGGERNPKHWIERVAGTKEMLSGKQSLHMVHGLDVSRGVVGVIGNWEKAKGQRFVSELDEENRDEKMEGRQIRWIGLRTMLRLEGILGYFWSYACEIKDLIKSRRLYFFFEIRPFGNRSRL